MTIHKEGYKTIMITFLLVLAIFLASNHIWPEQSDPRCNVILGVWFFIMIIRLPVTRSVNQRRRAGNTCPADGKVVVSNAPSNRSISRMTASGFHIHVGHQCTCKLVSVGGEIVYYYYHPGKHMVAFNPKASLENERATTVIQGPGQRKVLVRQIAGAMARRIKCYPKVGEPVIQGEELGFIKFGSRVDLLLPVDTKIEVTLNQKVRGKQTIIGRIPA